MAIINFKCKKCREKFNYDVGEISFAPLKVDIDARPRFEREIVCENCGKLTLDEVELTELGQFQLGGLYLADTK